MPTIYRKTAKGLTEIKTRQHGLALRARSVLILVDGKRDHDSLKDLMGAGEATLATLLEQGFIEVTAAGSASLPGSTVEQTVPTRAPAAQPGATDGAGGDLAERCRAAVRELNEILGPTGEPLAIRMERSRDLAELIQVVQLAAQAINNVRGRAVAEGYFRRHSS